MKLAIQIVLYKSEEKLPTLLESLKNQTYRDFEVFMHDNSQTNLGFAGGHAKLFDQHTAPFVMLLNDDAKLDAGYLEAVMKRIESDERIASITGLVYRMDGQSIDTSGLVYHSLARIVDRHENADSGEVFGVSGAVGLYRRSAIQKAGGYLFDPAWFMYKEDVDLAIRLRRAGFIAWYEPSAVAWHTRGIKPGDSHARRPALLRQYSYVNQHHLYTLHAAWSLGVDDFLLSLLQEIGRTALVFIASPIVWVRSVRSLAKTFSYMWKRRKALETLGLRHIRMRV
ncbi:glycosyltransferase family 2 protein [Candidatus Uhrbacteria bacterium]|nr:glycosyltransferase family 2 protein [Candidatus Uhrbacteria bacterium]